MKHFAVIALGLLLSSCGAKNSVTSILAETGIMGGKKVEEKSLYSQTVVAIIDTEFNSICTGSILSENLILTAAHCVDDVEHFNLHVVFATNADEVMGSREPDVKAQYTRRVTKMVVHEDYNPEEQNEENPYDFSDIAILKIKGTIPEGFKPVNLVRNSFDLKRGMNTTLVGYGVSEVQTEPIDPKKVKNLHEAIEYGEVICDDNLQDCLKVDMFGDGILRVGHAPIEGFTKSEIRLDERDGGTCMGDSGGPAYIEKKNELFLFGITSRGSALCDAVGVYTSVPYHLKWIEKTIQKLQ